MAVKKKGNDYWIDIRVEGQRIRRRIGPDKKTAEMAIKAIQVQAAKKEWLGIEDKGKITFTRFFEDLFIPRFRGAEKTKRNYKRNFRNYYQPAFGTKQIQRIRGEHVEDWLAERMNGAAHSTVKTQLSGLKAILNAAVKWGYLQKSPAKGVTAGKVADREIRPLTMEQIRALYQAIDRDNWFFVFVATALNTGMRVSEIMNMAWSDIDFRRGQIAITNTATRNTKSRVDRHVPMNDFLSVVLREFKRKADPGIDLLYPSPDDPNKHFYEGLPLRRLKKAATKAGLPDSLRIHDLRHTFGTRLADLGENPKTIMELMGHADITMTMRYIHTSTAKKRDAVDRLEFAAAV